MLKVKYVFSTRSGGNSEFTIPTGYCTWNLDAETFIIHVYAYYKPIHYKGEGRMEPKKTNNNTNSNHIKC